MKITGYLAVFAVICTLLCSCTGAGNGNSDFVYYFALDRFDDDGVVLYAIMKNGEDSSDKEKKAPVLEEYRGENISKAFDEFFGKHGEAYTGTVKEYVIDKSLGESGLDEFKLYLANTPSLPIKRKTVTVDDASRYISEKLEKESE